MDCFSDKLYRRNMRGYYLMGLFQSLQISFMVRTYVLNKWLPYILMAGSSCIHPTLHRVISNLTWWGNKRPGWVEIQWVLCAQPNFQRWREFWPRYPSMRKLRLRSVCGRHVEEMGCEGSLQNKLSILKFWQSVFVHIWKSNLSIKTCSRIIAHSLPELHSSRLRQESLSGFPNASQLCFVALDARHVSAQTRCQVPWYTLKECWILRSKFRNLKGMAQEAWASSDVILAQLLSTTTSNSD
jgi:hypothetical protein